MPNVNFDRRAVLQQPVITRDPVNGDELIHWSAMATVWAVLNETTATEATTSDQRVMTRHLTLRIRYRADITSTWRCLVGARKLRISGIIEVGRKKYLDLSCEETTDV